MRVALLALAAPAAVLLSGSNASADTLVYVKAGTVYVSQADGSQARAITTGNNDWSWPSETDNGIIAVAGGLSRIVNGNFDPPGGDQIYEFDQQGRQLSGPLNTEASYSTVNDPEYVTHFRVAPDNSEVAWTTLPSYSQAYTAWQNPSGDDTFHEATDSTGAALPYSSPEWWGPGHLLMAYGGATIGSQAEYIMWSLPTNTGWGWNNDTAIGSASHYQLTISRDGLKFAVMTDDAPDWTDGIPRNVAVTLETTATPPTSQSTQSPVVSTGCTLTLPASQYSTLNATGLASMSFSSDGSTLAWAQDDGIYEANVSNPTNCSQFTNSVHMVVPGGTEPFLGAAPLSPQAAGSGSGGGTSGGGGSSGGGGNSGGSGSKGGAGVTGTKAPNTRIMRFTLKAHKHTVKVSFAATGGKPPVHFQCKLDRGRWHTCRSGMTLAKLRHGKHVLMVRSVDSRGKADATPAIKRFKV